MKKLIFFLPVVFTIIVYSQTKDKIIENILDEVSIDSLITHVKILSGEIPIKINDKEIKIKSRYTYNSSKILAAEYIKQKLQQYDLEVEDQYFDKEQIVQGRNVYGIKYGKIYPDSFVIISAHYDDISFRGDPCGADDNASGVAAVIEASRLLKDLVTNYSVIFALWDKEEVGLLGSNYFAENFNKIENVIAVINIDMIGYNTDGDDTVEIHTCDINNSFELSQNIKNITNKYNLSLSVDIKNPGTTYSDQASFWDEGISAILMIEEYWNEDFNECLHQPCDKIDRFNFEYFKECTKLAIATLSEFTINK